MFSFSFKIELHFNYIVKQFNTYSYCFISIFSIVKYRVNQHINEEIQEELYKHLDDVSTDSNDTYLIQVDQWRIREHNSFNCKIPFLLSFMIMNKLLDDKSPNLKIRINLLENVKNNTFTDTKLNYSNQTNSNSI